MITIASIARTHWHDGQGWDGPPWAAFFLIPLLLATLFIAGFIAGVLVQRSRSTRAAVKIVAARYAQGVIDEDEYRRRISELRGKGSPRPATGPK